MHTIKQHVDRWVDSRFNAWNRIQCGFSAPCGTIFGFQKAGWTRNDLTLEIHQLSGVQQRHCQTVSDLSDLRIYRDSKFLSLLLPDSMKWTGFFCLLVQSVKFFCLRKLSPENEFFGTHLNWPSETENPRFRTLRRAIKVLCADSTRFQHFSLNLRTFSRKIPRKSSEISTFRRLPEETTPKIRENGVQFNTASTNPETLDSTSFLPETIKFLAICRENCQKNPWKTLDTWQLTCSIYRAFLVPQPNP